MNNLKAIMESKKLTILRVSVDTGFSTDTLCYWRRPKANPSFYNACAIADYLKVDVREIWT